MSRQYINPPVVEAVCEFRLSSDTKWDLTIPGLVYERIQDRFPHKEQHIVSDIEINQEANGIKQQVRTNERIWFLTEDRKLFIQIGTRFLAINCLAPYPTWQSFKPSIDRAYETLSSIVSIQGLERIGLRYVNRIEIAALNLELATFFQFWPYLGERLPQAMKAFIVGCLLPYSDDRDACRIQLTTAVTEQPDTGGFVLDLDYFLAQPNTVSPENALDWVEGAHQNVETVFEGCITDGLREIFERA
jgi:uncharacterized protein (TIGR04255 family)